MSVSMMAPRILRGFDVIVDICSRDTGYISGKDHHLVFPLVERQGDSVGTCECGGTRVKLDAGFVPRGPPGGTDWVQSAGTWQLR